VTRAQLLQAAVTSLREAGVPDPAQDARRLLVAVAGIGAEGLTPHLSETVQAPEMNDYADAIARRASRVPLTQILGQVEFMGHQFMVTPDTLSPRPETEVLVQTALALADVTRILDLGTGTGCIAISLLRALPQARAVAVDTSKKALAVAQKNADALGVAARLTLVQGDWFAPVEGCFDLIVSNPPYIGTAEKPHLEPEVAIHEPDIALFAGRNGMTAFEQIIPASMPYLKPGGRLILESGSEQVNPIHDLMYQAGFAEAQIINDLSKRPRITVGTR